MSVPCATRNRCLRMHAGYCVAGAQGKTDCRSWHLSVFSGTNGKPVRSDPFIVLALPTTAKPRQGRHGLDRRSDMPLLTELMPSEPPQSTNRPPLTGLGCGTAFVMRLTENGKRAPLLFVSQVASRETNTQHEDNKRRPRFLEGDRAAHCGSRTAQFDDEDEDDFAPLLTRAPSATVGARST